MRFLFVFAAVTWVASAMGTAHATSTNALAVQAARRPISDATQIAPSQIAPSQIALSQIALYANGDRHLFVSRFTQETLPGLISKASDISLASIAEAGDTINGGFAIDTSLVYHYPLADSDPVQSAPEPGTLALVGTGLLSIGIAGRRLIGRLAGRRRIDLNEGI